MKSNPLAPNRALLITLVLALLSGFSAGSWAGDRAFKDAPDGQLHVYTRSGGQDRQLEMFFPPDHDPAGERVPGLILFHGGGWSGGSRDQFRATCAYFASRGLVTATADYRMLTRAEAGALPDGHSRKRVCATDAASAVLWLKANADRFGIDPDRIITGGGSAGGHISALATLNPNLREPGGAADIDTSVVAYLWFNPAFSPDDKTDPEIDVLPHLTADLPPAIVFFGTDDRWKNGWDAAHRRLRDLGVDTVDLRLAEGQPHGFFNRDPWWTICHIAADRFLVDLGLLQGVPSLTPPDDEAGLVVAEP